VSGMIQCAAALDFVAGRDQAGAAVRAGPEARKAGGHRRGASPGGVATAGFRGRGGPAFRSQSPRRVISTAPHQAPPAVQLQGMARVVALLLLVLGSSADCLSVANLLPHAGKAQ